MALVGLVFVFPIFWMISTSIRTTEAVFAVPPKLLAWPITFEPYTKALEWISFWRYFGNTLYIATVGSAGIAISSSLAAYGFARLKWPGRDLLFGITLATMMLPGAVYMIPLYLVWHRLGALGTFIPLWLPYWFGNAFSIFLITQMYRGIPFELSDAAKIDGCSEFQIWYRIMIPLARPVIVLAFLFHFTNVWKEFYAPFIYLSDKKMFTLTLALYNLQGGTVKADWNVMMAAATMIALPMLFMVPLTQRAFTSDIAATGIKG